jgi:hypothetical protein
MSDSPSPSEPRSEPRPDSRDAVLPVGAAGRYPERPERRLALVDLLDRVLAGGVVLRGDLSLCIADVELVRVSLSAVVASVSALTDLADAPDTEVPPT